MIPLIYSLQIYCLLIVLITLAYTIRHYIFTYNRIYSTAKLSYEDILDSNFPKVTVIIPMFNDEKNVKNVLNSLLSDPFVAQHVEILTINDHSTDNTQSIIDHFSASFSNIKCLTPLPQEHGKIAALNLGIHNANGEFIIILNAKTSPPKGFVKSLCAGFNDPEIACVTGRVILINEGKNLLTRLIGLEHSGTYQIDHQARQNLDLIAHYDGTVAGFRKSFLLNLEEFDSSIPMDASDLSFKTSIFGWKTQYALSAECYEKASEDWTEHARQIQQWSRNHNQAMMSELQNLLKTPYLSFWQKLDGIFLLFVQTLPILLLLGLVASIVLFFFGGINMFLVAQSAIFLMAFYGFGNFSPFYQITSASILDGNTRKIRLLPWMAFNFIFSIFYSSIGFIQAVRDQVQKSICKWAKAQQNTTISHR